MKILVLTNNFGGLYNFRKELMHALVDKNYEVVISAPIDEKAYYFEANGCQLVDTRFNRKGTNPLKDFSLLLKYVQILRQQKPDMVLSYTIKPNLYGGMACRLCRIPQIANITGLGSAVENPGWLQRLTILLYKVGLRKVNTVFFQNRANMHFCEQHGMVRRGQKILIPGSGVNLQYHSMQDYPAEINPLRFIFIGRLLREKGFELYMEAAERIKEKHPNTEFHVVGANEDANEEQFKELQHRGIIFYHGRQVDVRSYIRLCHCTVHPSYYPEGMSNVLLESCAAGRPIITTDRPGCGEIVDDGMNGFIVKQRDSNDLVNKIERFIALPFEQKKQMGQAARKKVEREFDRQIVVQAYLNAIDNVSANL